MDYRSTKAARLVRPLRLLVHALALVLVLRGEPAQAWQQRFAAGMATKVVVDPSGNPIAVGGLNYQYPDRLLTIMKLDGAAGTEVWRDTHLSPYLSFSNPVIVDGNGDVIGASGTVEKISGTTGAVIWNTVYPTVPGATGVVASLARDAGGDVIGSGSQQLIPHGPYSFTVFKQSGLTGAQLWQNDIVDDASSAVDVAAAVTTDASGDVIAAGCFECSFGAPSFVVVKYDGASGSEIWRALISEPLYASANFVEVDGAGDVIAVGTLGSSPGIVAAKFSGVTGGELWRSVISGDYPGGSGVPSALELDAGGNPIIAGRTRNTSSAEDLAVVKLSGASGAELWRQEIDGAAHGFDIAHSMTMDGSGDVVVGGYLKNGSHNTDFVVIKFSGASGAEIWRQQIDGGYHTVPVGSSYTPDDEAMGVAVNSAGDVYAVGHLKLPRSSEPANNGRQHFTVVKLNGTDGSLGTLAGKSLRVTDKSGDPTRRKIAVVAEDFNLDPPEVDSPNNPITSGATLQLTGSGDTATFVLPAGPQWRAANPNGYKYSDPTGINGPCRQLVVQPGKRLKATCLGRLGNIPFSLDEATQGALTLSFKFGAARARCVHFGGTILRDVGTDLPAPAGMFRAKDAPATELACPEP